MSTVDTYQARTHFTDLVKRVEAGEDIVAEFRKPREAVAKRGGRRGLSVKKLIGKGRM
jgi:antitoxin (DNA-binding transcriptional repressor) of toxin-antitoxin stability system